jgi:hypothetical protein
VALFKSTVRREISGVYIGKNRTIPSNSHTTANSLLGQFKGHWLFEVQKTDLSDCGQKSERQF